MRNTKEIEAIKNGMLLQDKRSTSYPIFIVVEDRKIYGVDSDFSFDGRERKDDDYLDRSCLCEECDELYEKDKELPEDCEECDGDAFIYYRMERDTPNMRAAFFFTAQACNEHIERNRHHYNSTAHSYAISACYNYELQAVMVELIGEANVDKLR